MMVMVVLAGSVLVMVSASTALCFASVEVAVVFYQCGVFCQCGGGSCVLPVWRW